MRINQSRSGKCSATEFFNSFPSLHFRLYSITMKPYSPTKSLVPPTTLLRVLESCGRNMRFSGRIIGTHSTTSITGKQAYFRQLIIRSEHYHTDWYYCSSQSETSTALCKTIKYIDNKFDHNNEVTTFAPNFTFHAQIIR